MTFNWSIRPLFLSAILTAPFALHAKEFGLFYSRDVPQLVFAASEIDAALQAKGQQCAVADIGKLAEATQDVRIVLLPSAATAQPFGLSALGSLGKAESYLIFTKAQRSQTSYLIVGNDPVGAMYGGLDVAEAIKLSTLNQLKDGLREPFVPQRGIKFNIPLDARTPSYSDAGDSAQQNIPEMWSMNFWHEFLDEMARDRLDVLSLWNLHPFPSLIKVPTYPDVALNDVMRSTEPFDTSFNLTGKDMVRPSMLSHLETVKTLSIDQKIAFWRDVMKYAHDRGIDVYLFTWNIFVFGAEGKYGITSAQDNPVTIDYFRRSVAQTLITYPLLKGIGVTAGENMQRLSGDFTNEKWLWKTYGQGILDAKAIEPNRAISLIHRLNQADVRNVVQQWQGYPDKFALSTKYSAAHMYSSTTPPFAWPVLNAMPPSLRAWLEVRNDDIYDFRWGDPDFARDYISRMPGPDKLAGFLMGSDGYIWGRECTSTEPDSPRQLFIKKHQYSCMIWGRLAYDPRLSDSVFQKYLATRFPEADPSKLFTAYCFASRVIPQINRFFWCGGGNDLGWFPEACVRHPGGSKGFYTVADFMKGKTMPGSGILDISGYCDGTLRQQALDGITPLQVAAALRNDASTALQQLSAMSPPKEKELRLTLGDLSAMSYLGNYYAEKILAATDLALFQRTGKSELKLSAGAHLTAALANWRQYAAIATRQYKPELLTRIGYVDFNALTSSVQRDIIIAQNLQPQSPDSNPQP